MSTQQGIFYGSGDDRVNNMDQSTFFMYQNKHGNIKDPNKLFTTLHTPSLSTITYGNIATANSHAYYSNHSHHQPEVTYTCDPTNPSDNQIKSNIETYVHIFIYKIFQS